VALFLSFLHFSFLDNLIGWDSFPEYQFETPVECDSVIVYRQPRCTKVMWSWKSKTRPRKVKLLRHRLGKCRAPKSLIVVTPLDPDILGYVCHIHLPKQHISLPYSP
jgi:hypothetical protein